MSEIITGNYEYPEWYNNIPDGTYVGTHEIAKRMGVKQKTVIDWIEADRLKASQPGGPGSKYIVAKEELGRFLKSSAVTPDRFKELKEILSNSNKEHPEKPNVTVQSEPKNQGISFSQKRWNELSDKIDSIQSLLRSLVERMEVFENRLDTAYPSLDSKPRKHNHNNVKGVSEGSDQPLLF